MKNHDEILLETAVNALRSDRLDETELSAAAKRVAHRLGLPAVDNMTIQSESIESCADVRELLHSYRSGTLSQARGQLIEAHLRDCGACMLHHRSNSKAPGLDWSSPEVTRASIARPRAFGWVLAPAFALLVCMFFVYKAYWQVPPGVRAEVQSIDGSAYRISDAGDHRLSPGDKLAEGDLLRTGGGGHAVLRLSDGSRIEVNERTVLGVGARGHNMTVSVDNGAVIVQAAKRDSGHLYVKTPDCRVAVTGTVFSVDSGIKGSRVAVLQGSVQFMHGGLDTLLHAGEQESTSDNLSPAPLETQISWSQERVAYLSMLAQAAALQRKLESIPYPQLRYSSDLLQRVPDDTLLYVSIPNLGDYLSEANKVFQEQLKHSPALEQWWNSGHARNTADLDALVEKLHQMSQYLGDEVVVVGVKQAATPSFAIIADVQKSGLDDYLKSQLPSSDGPHGLVLLNEQTLNATASSTQTQPGGYAFVGQHYAVFSNNVATLKQVNLQLNAGASGFAAGAFGQQIASAYSRGAGVILAADLHQMVDKGSVLAHANQRSEAMMENSGIDGVQYLIAEHREMNGVPQNHLNLQFSGTRQRVASWLAAPAPMGSLDFVSPNAAAAVAVLSKDPKSIADDILAMVAPDQAQQNNLTEIQATLGINFRDDIAAQLGGDFLVSLDGPVLPTPSWKAVIEVNDPDQLESTLERLTKSLNQMGQDKKPHNLAIETSNVDAQRFYSVRELTSGRTLAQYTFSGGYMILAPERALLIDALRAHTSGQSLARSTAFKELLPRDENENYSAIAYQNLGPELTPLLSQLSGDSARTIQQLAADARPTAICAWGKDSRIEVASDSHLFGFDFLTLGTLMNSGNKKLTPSVKE